MSHQYLPSDSFRSYHPATPRPRIIYIGLSLEFYRAGDPACVERFGEIFDHFAEKLSSAAEITARKLCFTEDEIESVLQNNQDQAEVVVISALSYTGSCMSVPSLKRCSLPVVFWNTQYMQEIADDFSNDDLYMNHTVQGLHDVGALLFSSGVKFRCVTGHCDSPEALKKLSDTLLAVRAARNTRNMKVLCIGGMFEGMGDFLYDPEHIRSIWGPTAENVKSSTLMEYFNAVSPEETAATAEREQRFFNMQLSGEDFRISVRMALALEKLLRERNCQALTVNFKQLLDDKILPTMPFYGINRLMAKNVGYAGEGDMLRAAMMSELNMLGGLTCFTEIYTIDFANNLMLMSHMQECNPAWARRGELITLQRKEFSKRVNPMPYAGMHFTLEPGDATLVNITQKPDGKLRLIAFAGTITDHKILNNYPSAHWLLHTPDVCRTLDCYSQAGGTHHLCAMEGIRFEQLKTLAYCHDMEFYQF